MIIGIGVLSSLTFWGCNVHIENDAQASPNIQQEEEEQVGVSFHSGWIPYWDIENAQLDWMSSEVKPEEIVSFGVLYEGIDLYIPPETRDMTRKIKEMAGDKKVYLSFINDLKVEEVFYQKDKELLETILEGQLDRGYQVERIIRLAQEMEVDGIEIDFENLKDDLELWDKFTLFIEQLTEESQKQNLGLRVVLPYNGVKYAQLPQGPHYIIMCYNLYGLHSTAGPKADKEFLEHTFAMNQVLGENVSMAFANHGFSWSDTGEVEAITITQARTLEKLYDAAAVRDENSGCVRFNYEDIEGVNYEVWYGDETTMQYWMELATAYGYTKFALWRYGS